MNTDLKHSPATFRLGKTLRDVKVQRRTLL
jgi:hypothetical protein